MARCGHVEGSIRWRGIAIAAAAATAMSISAVGRAASVAEARFRVPRQPRSGGLHAPEHARHRGPGDDLRRRPGVDQDTRPGGALAEHHPGVRFAAAVSGGGAVFRRHRRALRQSHRQRRASRWMARPTSCRVNDGPNSLHGGPGASTSGSGRREPSPGKSGAELQLTYVSAAGEEGYPGELTAHVLYRLTDDDRSGHRLLGDDHRGDAGQSRAITPTSI